MTAAPPAAHSWRTARRSLSLERSVVLGIINVTPDSFSDGGRHFAPDDAVRAGMAMKEAGADILDVGGESTRPGGTMPGETEELRRVIPVIERLVTEVGLPVSVDTRRAAVARAAIEAGAEIVNDVSGLTHDAALGGVVADAGAGVIIMHMRGEPVTMDDMAEYDDVVAEVVEELTHRRTDARTHGIADECMVLDPGLGFAKKTEHNLELLAHLDRIAALGHPVMVGPSRKRFLGAITGLPVDRRDAATAAACVAARLNGAALFRVHDVRSAREALTVADAVLASAPGTRPLAPGTSP